MNDEVSWNDALKGFVERMNVEALGSAFMPRLLDHGLNKTKHGIISKFISSTSWLGSCINFNSYKVHNERQAQEETKALLYKKWRKPKNGFDKVNIDYAGFSCK